jgi:hypothetical protein
MVNHAYTILRQTVSYNLQETYPGDVFVPPNYRAAELPSYLRRMRTLLFGVDPDGLFANYRIRQLLATIEATDLRDFLKYYDSRITYDLQRDTLPVTLFSPGLRGDTYAFNLLGEAASPDLLGISHYRFSVESTAITMGVTRLGKYPNSFKQTLTITDGSSQLVPLSPTGHSLVYVVPGVAHIPKAQPEVSVDIYLKPTKSIADLVRDSESLPADAFPQLFGLSPEEPYRTFRNCWTNSQEVGYRLAGLVLAYVGRVTELSPE